MGTKMSFRGNDLDSVIVGAKVLKISRPARPKYERNKVVIPGKDGSYDFGNNRKEDFLVTVEVLITGGTAQALRLNLRFLSTYLDGKGDLTFSDDPSTVYQAQVYDEVSTREDATARWARCLITFECDA